MDYAFKALENSGTAVGVRCKDGIVFGVEKLLASKMLVAGSGRRLHTIDEHMGACVAGLMPDARQLVSRAREESRAYRSNFGGAAPPRVLSDRMGSFVHTHTVYWYLRPVGAAIMLGGYDAEQKTHELYCVEPNGMALRYFGYAIGEGGVGWVGVRAGCADAGKNGSWRSWARCRQRVEQATAPLRISMRHGLTGSQNLQLCALPAHSTRCNAHHTSRSSPHPRQGPARGQDRDRETPL